jgi:DNA-binding CsgD family transcriptional regulator
MVSEKMKELEATKAKLAALEKSIATELRLELGSLPAKYGFESVKAFIAALKESSTGGRGGKRVAKKKKSAGARRKRAVITTETRDELKKMVEDGKTGGEIAEKLGISLPSVQNIKKSMGLVRKK